MRYASSEQWFGQKRMPGVPSLHLSEQELSDMLTQANGMICPRQLSSAQIAKCKICISPGHDRGPQKGVACQDALKHCQSEPSC